MLSRRRALVTGAGRGIGRATAKLLASHGAVVMVNDLDSEACQETVTEIRQAGGSAEACALNLLDTDAAPQLIDTTIATLGGLDILVNNAGYVWNGAMHNHTDEQWQAMLEMHASVPFRLLRAYHGWLKREVAQERAQLENTRDIRLPCRKVVNISSVSGTEGAATQIAYSAGKAAVVGMTKTLAKEWGRLNVTVNAVAFGYIDTRLTQVYEDQPPTIDVDGQAFKVGVAKPQVAAMQSQTPLGRIGDPEDAAGAIFMFCIPASDFVTGQVLTCSGGL